MPAPLDPHTHFFDHELRRRHSDDYQVSDIFIEDLDKKIRVLLPELCFQDSDWRRKSDGHSMGHLHEADHLTPFQETDRGVIVGISSEVQEEILERKYRTTANDSD